ncbi:hypothetical protein GCM10009672_23900 [Nesterenkonia lutea]
MQHRRDEISTAESIHHSCGGLAFPVSPLANRPSFLHWADVRHELGTEELSQLIDELRRCQLDRFTMGSTFGLFGSRGSHGFSVPRCTPENKGETTSRITPDMPIIYLMSG